MIEVDTINIVSVGITITVVPLATLLRFCSVILPLPSSSKRRKVLSNSSVESRSLIFLVIIYGGRKKRK